MTRDAKVKLLVGLGNPGAQYAHTRHNVGFWWLDALADTQNINLKADAKFFGAVAKWRQSWLLKPATFVNASGQAVFAVARYHQFTTSEMLIVHDDLDLPVGSVRLKYAGGTGGHNGLKDIVANLGGEHFWRLRLGIGHPGAKHQVVPYVLSAPPPTELSILEQAIRRSLTVLDDVMSGEMERAIQNLHRGES